MEWRQEKLLGGIQFAFQSVCFIIMFWFNQIHYLYFIFPEKKTKQSLIKSKQKTGMNYYTNIIICWESKS